MNRIFLFLTIALALLGMNACGSPANGPGPNATVLLPTASPSAAPTATLAPTPTVIPTPKLPVAEGTSIPIPSQILSADNVDQAVELARYGTGVITDAAYSPDGKVIAIASTLGITLYQADTIKETLYFDTNAAVNSIAFSSNGEYLAGGLSDNTLKVWKTADGSLLNGFEITKDDTTKDKATQVAVTSVAFSPDGSLLVSGSTDGTVRLWKASDGSPANTFKDQKLAVSKVFFSPDGQALFSASGSNVRMLNVEDGKLIRAFAGESVIDATITADGKTLATYNHDFFGPNPSLILWDVQKGKKLITIKGNNQFSTDDITSIALSPDGQLVAAGWKDYSVKIWSVASGVLQNTYQDLVPKDYNYYANFTVKFSPDGKSLFTAGRDLLGMWNVANGSLSQNIKVKSEPVNALAISPDGKTMAAVIGLNIIFSQFPDGSPLPPKEQMQSNGTLDFSPDGNSLATGFFDNTAHILPLNDQGIRKSFETEKKDYITGVAFSPDGKVLALGAGYPAGKVELRQVADGSLLKSINLGGQTFGYTPLAFSPNGEILGVSLNDNIKILQVSDGKILKSLKGGISLAFSPDGTLLAAGTVGKVVNVWSIPDGKNILALKDRPDAVFNVIFSPDGKLLVAGSYDGTIEVFQASDGKLLKSWKGNSKGISALKFSSDGKLLISSSYDGTIRVWGLKP